VWPSKIIRTIPEASEDSAKMANSEHLEILRRGVEKWNKWREEHLGPKKAAAPAKKSTARKPISATMRKELSAMMKVSRVEKKKAA
jgi:hypothetical protein